MHILHYMHIWIIVNIMCGETMRKREVTLGRFDIVYACFFILLIALCVFQKANYMFSICIIVYAAVLFFVLKNPKQHIVLCAFLISFFTFLLASPVATLLLGSTFNVHFLDDAKLHFYTTMLLSVSFVWVGYISFSRMRFKLPIKNTTTSMRLALRRVSRIVFVITYSMKCIQYIEIGYYVLRFGYMYYYTGYRTAIPLVFEKISDLYVVAISIFLATNPSKRECKPIMLFFLIGGILSIITGKRYEFVYVIMLCIAYLILRNNETDDGKQGNTWISKRRIKQIIILSPLIIIFLMYVGSTRSKIDFEYTSLWDMLLNFMVDIGNSGKVIMRGYQFKEIIPKDKAYSFGSLIEYFKYSFFSELLFGKTAYNARSYEYVTSGHSFAYVITYYFSRTDFFSGHGQGSSFIAELYADCGYWGVILGSFALGVFVRHFYSISGRSVLNDAYTYFLFRPLLLMPRDTYCLPLTYILNFKYIAAFFMIYLISHYVRRE